MLKLLRSNILRLVKSKTFYICLALQALMTVVMTVNGRLSSGFTSDAVFTDTFSDTMTAFLIAVISSIFIGSDYHNGTIRNKLICGFSRFEIYLANLITVLLSVVALLAISLVIFFPLTLPLLGGFTYEPIELFKNCVVGTLVFFTYAAIMTAISMTAKNMTAAVVGEIIALVIIMFVMQIMMYECLASDYITVITGEDGEYITDIQPNPYKLSESTLTFFKIVLNTFPTGQLTVFETELINRWQAVISSVCLIGLSSAAGFLVFNKENIK